MTRTDIERKDVFISWTGKDKKLKDRIVDFLEQNGISCLESDYACSGDFEQWSREAAVKCSVFLLVYTEHTKDSTYVPIEVKVFKEQDDWKNRLVPVVFERAAYEADPFEVHATASAVFCDAALPNDAELQQILHKVQSLVIGRLHHTYFENTRPKYIRLMSLCTKKVADKQHDYAKLYVKRTLTEVDENGNVIGAVADAAELAYGDDICCISGAAGSGKTLYLQQLREAAGTDTVTIVLPCHKVASSNNDMFTLLYEEFTAKCGIHIFYSESNFKALLESYRLLLVLDGVDEISTDEGTRKMLQKVETYLEVNGGNTAVVFTTRNESDAKLLAVAGRGVRRLRLDMLRDEDIRQLGENLFLLFGISEKNNEFYLRLQDLSDEIKANPLLLSQLAIVYKENGDIPNTLVGIYDAIAEITFSFENHKDVLDIPSNYTAMMGCMGSLLKKFAYMRYNELSKGKNHPAERLFAAVLEDSYEEDCTERAHFLTGYLQERAILVENEFYHKMFLEYFTAIDYCGRIFGKLGGLKSEDTLYELFSHYDQPFWEAVIKFFLLKADSLADEDTVCQLYASILKTGIVDYTVLLDLCGELTNSGETAKQMIVADMLKKAVDGTFPPYGPLFWYVPTYALYVPLAKAVASLEDEALFIRALALLRDVCWTCGNMQTLSEVTDTVSAETLFEKAKPYLFGVRGALVELFLTGSTSFEGGADVYPRCFNVAEAKSFLETQCGVLAEMTVPFEDEWGLYTHIDTPVVGDEYIGWMSLPYDIQALENTLAQKSCRKVTGLLLTPTADTVFRKLSVNRQQITVLYIPENIHKYHTWWNAYPGVTRYIYADGKSKLYFGRCLRLPRGLTRVGWAKESPLLQEVYIPDTVTSIDGWAFYGCTALVRVEISEGVQEIGPFAFWGCASLQEIQLPQTLVKLGDVSFSQCVSLKEITLPGSLQTVGDQLFASCPRLQSVELAEGVPCVPYAAFQKCTALMTVALPTTLTEIAENAFLGCSALVSIHIPQGVKVIGEAAFAGCTRLEEVVLPDEMEEIGQEAFEGCRKLKEIHVPRGVFAVQRETFHECHSLTTVTLPTGLEEIGDFAFSECDKLSGVVLPDTLTYIGNFAFGWCRSLTEIHIPDGVDTVFPSTFSLCLHLQRITNLPADCELQGQLPREVVIERRTAPIMEEYTVPAGVTVIEPHAFENWKTLAAVYLPQGLVEIAENAFAGCANLTKLVIPEGVTTIGDNAFLGCEKLGSVSLPTTLKHIGNKAFVGCKALVGIKLPHGLSSIGFGAFEGGSLWGIRIPEGVTKIESLTFTHCEKLSDVQLPSTLQRIDDKAFAACVALEEVDIPDSVDRIGESAFDDCLMLKRAKLPKLIRRIPRRMFQNCMELAEIHIPDTVTVFEEGCFAGCFHLPKIDIPYGVTEIPNRAFFGCGALTEIVIPDTVKTIGDEAFAVCRSVETLHIPDGVQKIACHLANGCVNLRQVSLPQTVTEILWSAFKDCKSLQEITIPDSVTYIGEKAFAGCESLKTVVIPPSVRTLEENAFAGCTGLQSVTLSRRFEGDIARAFGDVDTSIFLFV